jgi:hypothetical protein
MFKYFELHTIIMNQSIVKVIGWASLGFTIIGSTMLSFFGESILLWIIYIIASINGIIFNSALLVEGKKKGVKVNNVQNIVLFIYYLFANIIAVIRLTCW